MGHAMNRAPDTTEATQAVARLVQYFETLSPQSVADLDHFYAAEARFKDPFNDVVGIPAIAAIFAHMFRALQHPRFVITERVVQGQQCFLTWEFHFAFTRYQAKRQQCILGATHLVFSKQGKVVLHRDYWDAAEELYEKLPVLGSLMRWLKRH